MRADFSVLQMCILSYREKDVDTGFTYWKKTENKEKTKMIDFIWDCIVEVFRNGDEH